MATSSRKQPESPISDVIQMCVMIAFLSGAGAVGGALGMARAEHIKGLQLFLAVVFGFMVGLSITWAVWRVVYRGSLTVLRRKAATSRLPWRAVLPVMYGVLLVCFAMSGFLGAVLTMFFIRNFLG